MSLHPAIRAVWHSYSEPLEGAVSSPYLDSAEPVGLVTVGTGNLIDPPSLALGLPFRRRVDGQLATRSEILASWNRVKALEPNKNKHLSQRMDSTLYLDAAALQALVNQRLDLNHANLCGDFPEFESWPLDAQMFAHSWAWAVGPDARYPRMYEHLRNFDFAAAATECRITPLRGTILERNRRHRVLLHNAAHVVATGLPRDVLIWPQELPIPAPDTEPEPHPADAPDELETPRVTVPSRRPPEVSDFAIVHPPVPLDRPALDTVIGLYRRPPPDDEPPPEAA